jgi:hypothetical protein
MGGIQPAWIGISDFERVELYRSEVLGDAPPHSRTSNGFGLFLQPPKWIIYLGLPRL